MKVEIWVPFTELAPGDFGADVPRDENGIPKVSYESDEGAPWDLVEPANVHATKRFNIIVDEKDLPAIAAHLAAKGEKPIPFDDDAVEEEDKHLILMLRHCRERMTERLESFFDSLNLSAASSGKKEMAVRLLEQARRRMAQKNEFTAAGHALRVAQKYNLTDVELVTRRAR